MTSLNQPIGILGGTFDPIHDGHLRTAIELQSALNLKEVRFIPCFEPVHRSKPFASSVDRLTMVQRAIENEPTLTVDTCEIDRAGPSYTIDTLEFLRKKFPNTPLCLILGLDALLSFPSWHRYQDIFSLAHLIVVHRPQYHLPEAGAVSDLLEERLQKNSDALHETLAGKIVLQPVTLLDISATDIRKQITTGKNPRFLLPDSVLNYILEHKVYHLK